MDTNAATSMGIQIESNTVNIPSLTPIPAGARKLKKPMDQESENMPVIAGMEDTPIGYRELMKK